MEIVEGAGGKGSGDWLFRYLWQSGDTEAAGLYDAEIVIVFADGGQRTVPSDDFFTVEVEMNVLGQPSPAPTDTVTAVRH